MMNSVENEVVGVPSDHGVFYATVDELVGHLKGTTLVAGDAAARFVGDMDAKVWRRYEKGCPDSESGEPVSIRDLAQAGLVPTTLYWSADGKYEGIDVVPVQHRLAKITCEPLPGATAVFFRRPLAGTNKSEWGLRPATGGAGV